MFGSQFKLPCRLGWNLFQRADTQAMAWACLGNAYRVASDLRRSEEALDEAEVRLQRSGGEARMRRRRSSASVLLCATPN